MRNLIYRKRAFARLLRELLAARLKPGDAALATIGGSGEVGVTVLRHGAQPVSGEKTMVSMASFSHILTDPR